MNTTILIIMGVVTVAAGLFWIVLVLRTIYLCKLYRQKYPRD